LAGVSEAGEQSWLLRVVDIVQETDDTRSISLRVPERLREEFDFRPGQFLTMAVPSPDTGLVARCYSLSSTPLTPDPITFTVKRTPEGYASAWIHDHVRVGDHLRVLRPAGIFSPRSLDDDLLLLAAGSGITPIMSIIRTVLAPVRDGGGTGRLALFYASRDRAQVIFADAIEELRRAHPDRFEVLHWLEEERGLPTADDIGAFAASYTTWDSFCCGPAPFMTTVAEALRALGFPRRRRHQERFVSLGGNPFGDVDT
jgi:3-ketosteroid 9alpha-monooxygenase subunit B